MNVRAIIVSLVVGALTVLLLSLYIRRLEVETSGGNPIAVVAAIKPLEPGTVLAPEMLSFKSIPQAYVDSRAIRKSDLARIIGLRVDTSVKPQQTVLWTDLAVTSDDRRQLSITVQPGMRAVGIRATADDAHFALIRPGDRVDVVASLPAPNNDKDRISALVVQNVLVLAVGLDTGGRELLGAQPSGGRSDQMLTLSVNPQQLQQVSLASERGRLTIGLRNPKDTRAIDALSDMPSSALLSLPARAKVLAGPQRPTLLAPAGRPE
ncbi:Flp pilus assembly protein CpaB [soil metagenome]